MRTTTKPLAFMDRMPIFREIADVADLSKLSKEEYEQYFWECESYNSNITVWEDGIEMAREEGAAEERVKNAITMKKKGLSTELISDILGMTPDEVEALPVG